MTENDQIDSISIMLYDVIENTALEDLGEDGWDVYKEALELRGRKHTLSEERKILKKLLASGWEVTPGFDPKNWREAMKIQKKRFAQRPQKVGS